MARTRGTSTDQQRVSLLEWSESIPLLYRHIVLYLTRVTPASDDDSRQIRHACMATKAYGMDLKKETGKESQSQVPSFPGRGEGHTQAVQHGWHPPANTGHPRRQKSLWSRQHGAQREPSYWSISPTAERMDGYVLGSSRHWESGTRALVARGSDYGRSWQAEELLWTWHHHASSAPMISGFAGDALVRSSPRAGLSRSSWAESPFPRDSSSPSLLIHVFLSPDWSTPSTCHRTGPTLCPFASLSLWPVALAPPRYCQPPDTVIDADHFGTTRGPAAPHARAPTGCVLCAQRGCPPERVHCSMGWPSRIH